MAKYVESHVSFNDMLSFVCEDKYDVEVFMKKLRDEQGLRINAMHAPEVDANTFRPKQPIEKFRYVT